uniref:Uncharacterized protein n=1 Tax=Anguilla anguilla TaxID=7936 RepID=A0A0E9SIA5_ANGAN
MRIFSARLQVFKLYRTTLKKDACSTTDSSFLQQL